MKSRVEKSVYPVMKGTERREPLGRRLPMIGVIEAIQNRLSEYPRGSGGIRGREALSHPLMGPFLIEVGRVRLHDAAHLLFIEMLPVLATVVAQQGARSLTKRGSFAHWLSDPAIGRLASYPDMDNMPRASFNHHEHKQRPEETI